MIQTSFLRQLKKFSLVINKRVTSKYVGSHQSVSAGQGLVIKDFKPYVAGDDYRAIDWKMFARSDKLFVKRYEEEKNLTVHIIVDYSGSMKFGSPVKADYAAMLGIGIAYLAMRNNEKFVLSTFTDKLELFKPRKGVKQLANIIKHLNEKKASGVTDFEKALEQYHKLIKSRSLIFIISDFLYPPDSIKNILLRLKHNDIRLIQVLDEKEVNLKISGDLRLKDSESNALMRTFVSPFLKKTYQDKLEDHNAKLKKFCSDIGARFYSFSTNSDIFNSFYAVLAR